jgi:PAS domain S-box-containing protein
MRRKRNRPRGAGDVVSGGSLAATAIPTHSKLTAGRSLAIFAPIIALIALTAILAITAWLFGWYRTEMLVAAAGAGGAMVLVAIALLYRQERQREAQHRTLENAEARVSGMLESAMDAIVTVDSTQHVVSFNTAAEAMFGCSHSEAIGAPLTSFIPDRFRHAHTDHVRRFGETGVSSRRMGAQRIVTGLRRNGEAFPIDASISHHCEQGEQIYMVILRDVTERIRAEQDLRRSKEELRELGTAAHQALEQEKRRIARELHDELGQALTALQMDVAWLKERLPEGQDAMASKVEKMQALVEGTVASTRRIASDLRPLMLDDLGLLPAVEWLVEGFTQRTGVPCALTVGDQELDIPDAHANAVFRIIQESLTNIAKHAQASHVDVAIKRGDDAISVSVNDNGVGFSPEHPRKPNSFGLLGLRERASLLGGEATVATSPGHGTRVEICIPTVRRETQP